MNQHSIYVINILFTINFRSFLTLPDFSQRWAADYFSQISADWSWLPLKIALIVDTVDEKVLTRFPDNVTQFIKICSQIFFYIPIFVFLCWNYDAERDTLDFFWDVYDHSILRTDQASWQTTQEIIAFVTMTTIKPISNCTFHSRWSTETIVRSRDKTSSSSIYCFIHSTIRSWTIEWTSIKYFVNELTMDMNFRHYLIPKSILSILAFRTLNLEEPLPI